MPPPYIWAVTAANEALLPNWLVCSFKLHLLLRNYHVPSSVPGARDKVVSQRETSPGCTHTLREWEKREGRTVDPPYLQVLCLQILSLANIYLWPPNQCLQLFHGPSRTRTEWRKIWVAQHTCVLLSWFRSHKCKQMSFLWSIKCHIFFLFLLFWGVILLFKITPKHSAEVPSNVPKHKNVVMCLEEKVCVR